MSVYVHMCQHHMLSLVYTEHQCMLVLNTNCRHIVTGNCHWLAGSVDGVTVHTLARGRLGIHFKYTGNYADPIL